MIVDFHPQAVEELREAAQFYQSKVSNLGNDFLDELERSIQRIVEAPQRFAFVHKKTRRSSMTRFPYGIYFRESGEHIRIIAVKHHSRDPSLGMDRT